MGNSALVIIVFGIFLLALVALDILMIVSMLRTGDERRQLIVLKASAFTLLVIVFTLVIDIIVSIVKAEAMLVDSFVKLSVTAMVYLLALLYNKRKYGN